MCESFKNYLKKKKKTEQKINVRDHGRSILTVRGNVMSRISMKTAALGLIQVIGWSALQKTDFCTF